MKIRNVKQLQQDLKQIDSKLSAKEISKSGPRITLEGTLIEVNSHHIGDIIVKYDNNTFLRMTEVENTPIIKLQTIAFDKENADEYLKILQTCTKYLPKAN